MQFTRKNRNFLLLLLVVVRGAGALFLRRDPDHLILGALATATCSTVVSAAAPLFPCFFPEFKPRPDAADRDRSWARRKIGEAAVGAKELSVKLGSSLTE